MQPSMSLACFLSVIRPPGVQFEDALLQILPVDKAKCPFVKDRNDIGFRLFTRHNPTVYQELRMEDDEALFASNFDFHDPTVFYFGAFLEQPDDGSGLMVRQSYMLKGQTNFIILDISRLEAGPWYFTAAENTWYIGNYAARFIDYMVSRGLNLNTTHLVGHSLGGQSAGVAGYAIKSGKVSRITGLDPALPLFSHLPLSQRLDPSDAQFVDVIHTDAGIFGYNSPIGHADFYPNGGISPQPGCELEVVLHEQRFLNKCDTTKPLQGFYVFHLTPNKRHSTLAEKLLEFFTYINTLSATEHIKDTAVKFGDDREENLRKTSPKLGATRKEKLKKHIYDKKTTGSNEKSILISKINKLNDRIKDQNTKLTQHNEAIKVSLDTKAINKDCIKAKETDVLPTEASYKREKRTNQEDMTSSNKNSTVQMTNIAHEVATDKSTIKVTDDTILLDNDDITKDIPNKNTNNDITTLHDANTTNHTTMNINDNLETKQHNTKSQTVKTTNESEKDNETIILHPENTATIDSTDDKKTTKPQTAKLQRRKRFISLFRNNENENFLFRMLEFLVKNRKNVIPVVTVMREINTLVKSANGELNHFSKERNNYIGAIPTLTPIKYDLELGESGIVSFIKKLFGLAPKGGKLSISNTK